MEIHQTGAGSPAATTKERILDVAEELFADHGYAGTSLRAVTAGAAVNLAAVNYHFGSKESLLQAAFDRIAGPTNAERLRLLDSLEERGSPDISEILDAFLTPALRVVLDLGARGPTATRFLGRTAADPSPAVRAMIDEEFSEVGVRFTAALGRALPRLDAGEVAWRFKLMVGVLISIQSDEQIRRDLPSRPEDFAALRARTLAFLMEGFSGGPASGAE